ncbi:hypothetical protein FQN55_009402 [Onygenales sp. PD_40]|nr:hypothetical protein FQN55_009402 [Onygenales sp. PD_40]
MTNPSATTPIPHPNGMPSFWRSEVGELDNHRSTAELPSESDIVIVGAGYSAAALVTHLLETCTGERKPSILVLEARQLCSGATGRNGGHLKPDPYKLAADLAAEYGIEAAAEVANFEVANLAAVKEYVETEKVDCDMLVTRAVDVQFSRAHSDKIKRGHDMLRQAGVKATKETFYLPEGPAEMVSGVKGAISAFSYTAGSLWPYKLIHHMFTRALNSSTNNVFLHTNTPVTSISPTCDAHGRWVLSTPRGTVNAKQLILATNAYTASLLPEYKEKIIPYRSFCSRIVTPNPATAPLLANTYALRFSDWDHDYLIPRPDGSIVVGGGRSVYFRDLEAWYGNVDDSAEVLERVKGYFEGYMQRHFRGWEGSGARVDEIWSGVMGYSSDRLPRIGPVPHRPGIHIMGGFTGHGMPQIFLCAKGLASMLVHGTPFAETGIPRLFEETEARLADKRNRVLEPWKAVKKAEGVRL